MVPEAVQWPSVTPLRSAPTDTVHDMGGMHGFGPVTAEPDEPVFHEPWESRVFGMMIVSSAKGLRQGQLRPAIEAIPAAEYLEASYYERWLRAVEAGLIARGTLTAAEIDRRVAAPVDVGPTADPPFAEHIRRALQRPNDRPPPPTPGRFAVGDRVTVARMAPPGHTRCPRYVRGVTGTVTAVHGGWPLPDRGDDSEPETLYTVRFERADLWGADAEPGPLFIDLWDSYLGAPA